jgi:glycosyltransferase involved in cell wall biosynthesis
VRVLFLADAVFEDMPGGSRVVARELARGLAGRGHEVTFLVARHTPDAPDDERRGGVRIVRYPGAGRAVQFVRAGRAACARLWAEQSFDVVHTHFAYAALGPSRAVPPGVPHVRSFYGPWDAEGWVEDCACLTPGDKAPSPRRALLAARNRLKRALRRRVESGSLRRSETVIVLSEQSRGEVASFGCPGDRIRKIAGGADVGRFAPPADKRAVRRALGLPEDRRILLSVRRLAPRMGLDNLIEAMPTVAARHPDALLLIGGKGPDRARLEKVIATAGIGAHVRLVGFIPEDQLAACYQAADLFVLPTLALEGFGLVTVEALACGTPVVGTPAGATPEILRQLDARLVTRETSPNGLADGILSFLEGAWARELTPDRLCRFVRERYTWKRHVAAVEALYEEVIPAARRRRKDPGKGFDGMGVVR